MRAEIAQRWSDRLSVWSAANIGHNQKLIERNKKRLNQISLTWKEFDMKLSFHPQKITLMQTDMSGILVIQNAGQSAFYFPEDGARRSWCEQSKELVFLNYCIRANYLAEINLRYIFFCIHFGFKDYKYCNGGSATSLLSLPYVSTVQDKTNIQTKIVVFDWNQTVITEKMSKKYKIA